MKLFIFDWSGVISDDRRSVYEANMRVFKQFNKPVLSMDEFLRSSTMTFPEIALNHGINEPADKLLELYKKCYNEVKKEGITPIMYFNVSLILRYIKNTNKRIAVLSSHPINSILEEAKSYKINELFDVIVGEVNNKVNIQQPETQTTETPQEIQEFSLTGSTVAQILTEGKLNVSLLIFLVILIASYIFFRMKEK